MSYSPTEEVMAAGPPVTISNVPGKALQSHSSADQYYSPSRSNSSAQSHTHSVHTNHQHPSSHEVQQMSSMEARSGTAHQDSFDIDGWPEGIEKPTRFLGMKVKPISQWSIKHIFCLSYWQNGVSVRWLYISLFWLYKSKRYKWSISHAHHMIEKSFKQSTIISI